METYFSEDNSFEWNPDLRDSFPSYVFVTDHDGAEANISIKALLEFADLVRKQRRVERRVRFSDLPLGARFRYPGRERVYVLLQTVQRREGAPLEGTIAEWREDLPKPGGPFSQNIFAHIPGEDCPEEVIYVD